MSDLFDALRDFQKTDEAKAMLNIVGAPPEEEVLILPFKNTAIVHTYYFDDDGVIIASKTLNLPQAPPLQLKKQAQSVVAKSAIQRLKKEQNARFN